MVGSRTTGRFAGRMKREHLVQVQGQDGVIRNPGDQAATPSTDARPAGRTAIRIFRGAIAAQVLMILVQPVLIGQFLSGGDDSKLHAHEMVGSAVGAAGILLVTAAVLVWRFGLWPVSVVLWSVLLLVAEVIQLTMGYDRHLGIHVPLGVVLAIAASFLYAWAFKPHSLGER
jgi:predicted Na+-dependent transporter